MMTKRSNQQVEMHLITIEDLVPTDHLLRKGFAAVAVKFKTNDKGHGITNHTFFLRIIAVDFTKKTSYIPRVL